MSEEMHTIRLVRVGTAAKMCGVHVGTFKKYVENGLFPLPHDPTVAHRWRVDWINHYLQYGEWPKSAKKRVLPPRGLGRPSTLPSHPRTHSYNDESSSACDGLAVPE